MKKKKLWMVISILAIFTGCSKESEVSVEKPNDTDEITLGIKQAALSTDIVSRGIGGVGDVNGPGNVWNGEQLYIYALSTGATDIVPVNAAAKAPTSTNTGAIIWNNTNVKYYYGSKSLYKFYGYHIDDAAGASPSPTGDITNGYSVAFTLDGTQDLMVAATNPEKDIDAVADVATNGLIVDGVKQTQNLYSSWSARRNVVPNLVFNHLLSRLKFTIKAGNTQAVTDGVAVTKILIYSKSQGTLVVVPSADGTVSQGISNVTDLPDDLNTATPFELKQKPIGGGSLTALTAVTVTDASQSIGESILTIPAESYKMLVITSQNIGGVELKGENPTILEKPSKGGVVANAFEEGKIYTIGISVYALEDIKVNATLTAWEDGGNITVDPDDTPNP